MDLVVSEASVGEATVLRLAGQLDIDTAPVLRAAIDPLLERGTCRIVVDLADLDFCDSIGLSTFVVAHQHCAGEGGYMRLAAPKPFLLRVITTVGLRDSLPVYGSVAEACAGDPAGLVSQA